MFGIDDGERESPKQEPSGVVLSWAAKDSAASTRLNWLLAHRSSGQTLEAVQFPGEPTGVERLVGVALKSDASVSLTYHFTRTGF
ncbi:MAG: hypothetical protein LAO06_09900 [Acidobacteriia bacterium]|nr:hypothetical protein [Terriglobia bacterium]